MAFRWRYQDTAGAAVEVPDALRQPVGFEDQQEAEAWFGDSWEDLRAAGVDAVVLLDGGVEVYGPMSLHEA